MLEIHGRRRQLAIETSDTGLKPRKSCLFSLTGWGNPADCGYRWIGRVLLAREVRVLLAYALEVEKQSICLEEQNALMFCRVPWGQSLKSSSRNSKHR